MPVPAVNPDPYRIWVFGGEEVDSSAQDQVVPQKPTGDVLLLESPRPMERIPVEPF